MLNNRQGELFNEMVFPRNLETDFELIEEFPDAKLFHCFRVKDRRRGGAEAVARLLPERPIQDKTFIEASHENFFSFVGISNRMFTSLSIYNLRIQGDLSAQ